MNAPLGFMLLPVVSAGIAYMVFPYRPRVTIAGVAIFTFASAFVASVIPLDEPLKFLGASFPISGSFDFLGRQFVFSPSLRFALLFLYLGGGAFFAGCLSFHPDRQFLPIGLFVLSLLSASLFVQPPLFAAFFLLLSVAFLSLLLSDPSHPSPRGAVRWISYSVFGMLFLLLVGSRLAALTSPPSEPASLRPILLLLCLGFGLFLAFPPFHFWLPDVADDSPPYVVAFILSIYTGGVIFFLLRFLSGFSWLRSSPDLFLLLQAGGAGMCFMGACFSVFQTRLGRAFGYLSLCNLGAILLALSINQPAGVEIAVVLLVLRGFSLFVWGLSFRAIRSQHAADSIEHLRGMVFSRPISCAGSVLSALSLAGAPGLLSFPGYWSLLRLLSSSSPGGVAPLAASLLLFFSMLLGSISLFRFAHAMLQAPMASSSPLEKEGFFRSILLFSIGALFFFGLFPQTIIPWIERTAFDFTNAVINH
jgi:NADH-quinone oxidoreductase subunit N